MALSRPVAFQKPAAVARFVRVPVGYFLSLWLKKYQSFCGPDPILHFSAHVYLLQDEQLGSSSSELFLFVSNSSSYLQYDLAIKLMTDERTGRQAAREYGY